MRSCQKLQETFNYTMKRSTVLWAQTAVRVMQGLTFLSEQHIYSLHQMVCRGGAFLFFLYSFLREFQQIMKTVRTCCSSRMGSLNTVSVKVIVVVQVE